MQGQYTTTTRRDALIEEHEHIVYEVARVYASKRGSKGYQERYEDLASYLLVQLVECVDDYLERSDGRSVSGWVYIGLSHDAMTYHQLGRDDIMGHPYQPKLGCVREAEVCSLDAPLGAGSSLCLADVLADDGSKAENDGEYAHLYEVFETLSERTREAIGVHYGLPGYGKASYGEAGSFREHARRLGVSLCSWKHRLYYGLGVLRRELAEVEA